MHDWYQSREGNWISVVLMNSREHDQLLLNVCISKSSQTYGWCMLINTWKILVHTWIQISSDMFEIGSLVPNKTVAGVVWLKQDNAQWSTEMCTVCSLTCSMPSSHADSEVPWWYATQKVVCDMGTDSHHYCHHSNLLLSFSAMVLLFTCLPLLKLLHV